MEQNSQLSRAVGQVGALEEEGRREGRTGKVSICRAHLRVEHRHQDLLTKPKLLLKKTRHSLRVSGGWDWTTEDLSKCVSTSPSPDS